MYSEHLTVGFELEAAYDCLCEGTGYIPCDECDGGRIECQACAGEGTYACPECEGAGEVTCYQCSGDNPLCSLCEGTGHVPCSLCRGDGFLYCDECDGYGWNECHTCEGEGTIPCEACQGSDIPYDAVVALCAAGAELVLDCSVTNPEHSYTIGIEARSKVLRVGVDDIRGYVYDVVNALTQYGDSDPRYTCGAHVHLEPPGGWTDELANAVIRNWLDWGEQWFVDHFQPDEYRLGEYANLLSSAGYACDGDSYRDMSLPNKVQGGRYFTLNTRAYRMHGTYEWRLFDGTNCAETMLEYIQAVVAFYLAATDGDAEGWGAEGVEAYFEYLMDDARTGVLVQSA